MSFYLPVISPDRILFEAEDSEIAFRQRFGDLFVGHIFFEVQNYALILMISLAGFDLRKSFHHSDQSAGAAAAMHTFDLHIDRLHNHLLQFHDEDLYFRRFPRQF